MSDRPKFHMADILQTAASGATLSFAAFEDMQRHQQRREFWTAFRRYRLRVEAGARLMLEREGKTI